MKFIKILLISSLSFLINTAYAAPISKSGGYLSSFIGGTHANTLDTGAIPPPAFAISELENTFGGNFGFQLGYQIDSFRIEGQMFYNYSNLNSVETLAPVPPTTEGQDDKTKGRTQIFAAFANVFYDFNFLGNHDSDGGMIPYIGLGIGVGRVDASGRIVRTTTILVDETVVSSEEAITFIDTNETASMIQGIFGANLYLDSVFSMTFDYRYMQTGTLSNLGDSKVQLHSFNIGFKTLFA